MRDSWKKIIDNYNKTASFTIDQLLNTIDSTRERFKDHLEVYPSNQNIFKCFDYCDISEIKVVIIGQDHQAQTRLFLRRQQLDHHMKGLILNPTQKHIIP